MRNIKVTLIGLGNIGAFYDINENSSGIARTHLRAIVENDNFEITALIEPDKSKWKAVQDYYKLNASHFYSALSEMPKNIEIDLAVFAAPPSERLENLKKLKKHGLKLCVFEKPMGASLVNAQKIEDFCNQNSIQAIVNFHRRYDVNLQHFKQYIMNDAVPSKVIVHYTKGIKNYGSHAIDLLMDYFGEVVAVQAIGLSAQNDPLIDGVLHFKNKVQAHLIGHDTDYDLFEFEFFCKSTKYTLAQGTTRQLVQHVRENLIYQNYTHLNDLEEISGTTKVSGMIGLYDDISCFFKDGTHILQGCNLKQAKKSMVIIENLLKSAADKRYIEL